MVCAWRRSLPAKKSAATIARYVNLYRIICPSMTNNCFFELSLRLLAGCVYRGDECPLWVVVSTGRRNTGGQLAINNDDGLPNARPIAFNELLRNQLSHNVIFSFALVQSRRP